MRVNPNPTPGLLDALQRTQREVEDAMLQMSSGRRVNVPSDDPAAAAVLVQNQAESAQVDQFLKTSSSLSYQLQTADSTLNSVVLALQRAISLGVEGATGTLSDANRASLAQEVSGIRDQLVSLANLSFQGRFVFAGTETQTQPFVVDPTQTSGVRYDGNTQVNYVTIGEGLSQQTNLPGTQIFMAPGSDMFQAVTDLVTSLQNGTGMDAAVVGVRAAFDFVTGQRVFYGNAVNQIEGQQSYLNTEKLQLSQQQNDVGGADLAAAASNLVNTQNARSATLEAVGRVSQLNLFDYLT